VLLSHIVCNYVTLGVCGHSKLTVN